MFLKINRNTSGDLWRHQESPNIIFNTTRRHNNWFQAVDSVKNSKISRTSSRCSTFTSRIQNLGSTQLGSTSKIIRVDAENSSLGYNLTIGILVKRRLYHRCVKTSWFLKLFPWRRMLRTTEIPEGGPEGPACVSTDFLVWDVHLATSNGLKRRQLSDAHEAILFSSRYLHSIITDMGFTQDLSITWSECVCVCVCT